MRGKTLRRFQTSPQPSAKPKSHDRPFLPTAVLLRDVVIKRQSYGLFSLSKVYRCAFSQERRNRSGNFRKALLESARKHVAQLCKGKQMQIVQETISPRKERAHLFSSGVPD